MPSAIEECDLLVPDEARRLWCTLANDEDALQPGTTTVVRGSLGMAPAGWTGVVRLGDAWLIEAGDADDEAVDLLCGLDDPSDPAQVASAVTLSGTLGPGELAYLPQGSAVAAFDHVGTVQEVPLASIRGWLDSLPAADVEESSVDEMEQVLVLSRGKDLLGAAGHLNWPAGIGHVGILVAPRSRGTGAGVCLGAAATQRVLDHGLTPQWRAASSNPASRQIARRIGYLEVGRQFSFEIAPTVGKST